MSFGAWAKSNWLILVLSGVAVVAAPTGYYFSSKMHKKLVTDQQTKAQKDLSDFNTYTVKYSLPSVRQPDQKSFEIDGPLNKKLIDFFQVRRDSLKSESAKVGSEAVRINEGEGARKHVPLEPGVFPRYRAGDKQVRQDAMRRAYHLTAHQALLARIGAGGPPNPARVGDELKQVEESLKAAFASQSGTTLSPEQEDGIKQRLLAQRLSSYRAQAAAISVYADMKTFLEIQPFETSLKEPTLATMWDWQVRYWIADDVFTAIADANQQRTRQDPEGVPGSAIKRVLKFSVAPPEYGDMIDDPAPLDGTEAPPTETNPVPLDPTASITGRKSRPDNQFYDVRNCTIEAVVAPDRLPALFDALARANLMTVLRVDMDEYNPADDLREGYYYGDEHVVKAIITIETVWLRAWTVQYMPESVKRALMVLEKKDPAPADPATPPQ